MTGNSPSFKGTIGMLSGAMGAFLLLILVSGLHAPVVTTIPGHCTVGCPTTGSGGTGATTTPPTPPPTPMPSHDKKCSDMEHAESEGEGHHGGVEKNELKDC